MKLLLLVHLLLATVFVASNNLACRCRPHQQCWPSAQEWSSLNQTIEGNLAAVRPIAAACHPGPGHDSTACKEITSLWTNSTWRAAQPGAVQRENWEAWPERNESCYIDSAGETPCGQGRISLYSVQAKSAAHVQAAVRFAKQHNLRLAIRNSGHDFLGRSAAPESLQILTIAMKGINIVDDFVPSGGNISEGQAATLDAGVSLQEMYAALGGKGKVAVSGAAHTVGPTGGYIQGGGHSFLGTWKGMASDNALEFSVVTAAGDLVVTNEYQNSDLFWALRGGGGGTFGVVINATIRTFDDAPMVITNVNITTAAGDPKFWEAMEDYHALLPTLNDAGGAGYYFMLPDLPLSANTSISALASTLMFPNTTDTAKIDQLYAPLLKALNATAGVTPQYRSFLSPSIVSFIPNFLIAGDADDTGTIAILGSRLFSRDLLVSDDGPKRLISAFRSLQYQPSQVLLGHVVAGGAVAENAHTVDSALSPAWRKTLTHIVISRSWSPNATLQEQNAVRENLTNVEVPILQRVEGAEAMGAYLNEADANEPDFQKSFFGAPYPRLYDLKQKWDPSGLFIARKTVGSEDWDEEGLCPV